MKKIELLKIIDIVEEAKREETLIYTKDGRTIYSEQFRVAMMDLQKRTGLNNADFANTFFPESANMRNTIGKWNLKKSGELQFGYKWGKGIAYDLVDKAKMIKSYIEDGATFRELSNRCGKSPETIAKWHKDIGHSYQHIIDTYPRGVMYIMKESKKLFTVDL